MFKFFNFLVILPLLFSCDLTSSSKNIDELKNGVIVDDEHDYFDVKLANDAKNKVSYSPHYYCVLIDSVTPLYTVSNAGTIESDSIAKRGTVFSKMNKTKSYDGFLSISINEKAYYIENKSSFFEQEVRGMRYPLYGIVTEDNSSFSYYENGKQQVIKLKKGTSFLYVITKDKSYINLWVTDKKQFLTGEFCCKASIIQAKDHLMILREYKSTMSKVLE